MKRALIPMLLLVTAAASPAQERDGEGRWVCVPTENWEWRCGRGVNAPEPAPLPPARDPEPPPQGYRDPAEAQRVPYYLLDPTLPGPEEDAGREPATPRSAPAEEAPGAAVAAGAGPEPGAESAERPQAARPGEATAAAPGPAKSEPPPAAKARTGDAVGDVENGRYAIQLAAARDPDSLAAYRRELALERLDVYRRAWEDAAGTWHVLLTGRFATASQASRALADLPQRIRERGAWVRPLDTLQPASREP